MAGFSLLTDVHTCRQHIGFCPQFDALFELLTSREHLQMYARIKGDSPPSRPAIYVPTSDMFSSCPPTHINILHQSLLHLTCVCIFDTYTYPGIAEKDINKVVDAKISEMGLTEYADRLAGTYSGTAVA